MKIKKIFRSPPSILIYLGLLFFLFLQWQPINITADHYANSNILNEEINVVRAMSNENKQKGAHVFGKVDTSGFQFLDKNNVRWITIVAWSFQDDFDSPIVKHHNGDSLRMQRADSSWLKRIEALHESDFKVFVKPHIWMDRPSGGKWRSDIFPANDNDWELWKESYRNFILRYARIAERAKAEMFCLGTELSRLSIEKPEFWQSLNRDVRSIYSGKVTYAANWYNEYEKITFWDELDYIGIQAYFPLVKNKYPSVNQISKGWKKYLPTMKSLSNKFDKKILFTEMGYKSIASGAIKPWEWIEDSATTETAFSLETQANCYKAFFKTIWKKDWFAGVHIWQLRFDYRHDPQNNNLDFTPQGKPAEKIIASGFE